MYPRVLRGMRTKIRQRQYVMTAHADEEVYDDGLTIYDVERGILTGEIIERQIDEFTGEDRYCIKGETVGSLQIEVIAKIGPTGILAIITLYLVQKSETA